MNLDAIPDRVFWPLVVLAWLVVSLIVGVAVGSFLRACGRRDEQYRIDRVDFTRCERAGSQRELERRIRTAVGQ